MLPIAVKAGIDPVYFGLMFVLNGAIGLITPPVGTVLNVVAGVGRLSMHQVIKGVNPFLITYCADPRDVHRVPRTRDRAHQVDALSPSSFPSRPVPQGDKHEPEEPEHPPQILAAASALSAAMLDRRAARAGRRHQAAPDPLRLRPGGRTATRAAR